MAKARVGVLLVLSVLASCELYWGHPHGDSISTPDAAASPDVQPISRTPILHYPFDETLANTGALGRSFDATGTSISFVAGKDGHAVAFDTTMYTSVVLPSQVLLSSHRTFTIGLWFREALVWNGGLTQYLFDNRGGGGFQTYHGYGGNEALTTCSDAGCAGFGYSIGTWHHLIYRYDGDAPSTPLELFVDGALAATLPASDVYFSATQKNIVLGTRTNMQIDDVVVYAEVLSREEQCTIVVGGAWTNGTCSLP